MIEIKKFQKRALTLGVTGIGLGMMAGIDSSAAPVVSSMGKGIGMAGNLAVLDMGAGMLTDIQKKIKRRY